MKRREFLMTAPAGVMLTAVAARAEGMKMQKPWEWTDENGLARFLKVDTAPLENEFDKYPRCAYCGMMRKAFSYSRHLIVYDDDTVDGTCSLHCAAISLSLNMDRGPKTIYAGDNSSAEEIKPLVDVDQATYVLDPSIPGTMAKVSNWAYSDRTSAEVAAEGKDGAELTDFNGALAQSYAAMAQDTADIRGRRAEKRKRMGG